MTLRTPRRRISPRTKLRYRAIREFFRRALGSTSQQEIKINSSIAVNVTDLKRKIFGLEQQLDEVSKHCHVIAPFDDPTRRESDFSSQSELKDKDGKKEINVTESQSNGTETKVVYRSAECNNKQSDNSDLTPESHNHDNMKVNETIMSGSDETNTKVKNKKHKLHKTCNSGSKLQKHKSRSANEDDAPTYSTSSFHSLKNERISHNNSIYPNLVNETKQLKSENTEEIIPRHHKNKHYRENIKKKIGEHSKRPFEDKPMRVCKNKRYVRELDEEFIADIIRRQYKPVKLFNKKQSNLSQFSAPVCRDLDHSAKRKIKENEYCSCLNAEIDACKPSSYMPEEIKERQSLCDTHLYNSKKHVRQKHRRMYVDNYSNSDMYDLVPVKERSSPKTRRKFVEDNRIPYECYKEVPPSPRTLRPRLNLKSQYYTEVEDEAKLQAKKQSPKMHKRYRQERMEQCENEVTEDIPIVLERSVPKSRRLKKHIKIPFEEKHQQEQTQEDTAISGNLEYPQYVNEQTSITVDTALNKTHETEISADKTDKALCEIKDILQSFLHEIKRETVASQSDKSDISCKMHDHDGTTMQNANNNNNVTNSRSYNNMAGQCNMAPYIAPFTNPCCYPIMPLCSFSCPMSVPNGCLMHSQSYTCANCQNGPKESNSAHCCSHSTDIPCHEDTDELIKKIYMFVAHGSVTKNETDNTIGKQQSACKNEMPKILTSRSTGESYRNLQQDANVGTQPLKCYSKSCEAIGAKTVPETYYAGTDVSYSESLLEKLSLEPTVQSTSETEWETDPTTESDKPKGHYNKFSKVLRSFGFFKKKKKDVIEELTESESVIDIEVQPSSNPPYPQQFDNYVVHGHQFYQPPPMEPLYERPHKRQSRTLDYQSKMNEYYPRGYNSQTREYQKRSPEYQPECQPPYNPGIRGYSCQPDPCAQMRDHENTSSQVLRQQPSAPPFHNSYNTSYSNIQPPLCLKEIEVKSTGTQSDRKISIFKKLTWKISPERTTTVANNTLKQTLPKQAQNMQKQTEPVQTKSLFNWRNWPTKPKQDFRKEDDMISIKRELVYNDQTMRNMMIKKLLLKKNPFSARNLLVKALLRKDNTTFSYFPSY